MGSMTTFKPKRVGIVSIVELAWSIVRIKAMKESASNGHRSLISIITHPTWYNLLLYRTQTEVKQRWRTVRCLDELYLFFTINIYRLYGLVPQGKHFCNRKVADADSNAKSQIVANAWCDAKPADSRPCQRHI